jgi:hypothetical protein
LEIQRDIFGNIIETYKVTLDLPEVKEYRISPLMKNKNYRKIRLTKRKSIVGYIPEGKRINDNNKKSYG